jgi:hypothetical protein
MAQQPSAPQEQHPSPGQPIAPQLGVSVENPGQTYGIIGIVCNVLGVSVGGIVLGILSRNKSKQYNMSTTIGTVSLVWGIIGTVSACLLFILVFLILILETTSPSSSSTSTIDDSTSAVYSTN